MEMVVCSVILSVVAAVLVPGIHAVHGQRIETRAETYGLIELNNLAAKLRGGEVISELVLSSWFVACTRDASLIAEELSSADSGDTACRSVRLTIRRNSSRNRSEVTQSLVVWLPAEEGVK